jgi:hypothetical protein
MYSRSRSVAATVSSSSARLPPTSRWIRIAITTHSKSRLSIRSATPSMASSRGTPRRLSTITRLNSEVIGSVPSRTIVSVDWASDRPAERTSRHQLERVGQCGLEGLDPPLGLEAEEEPRQPGAGNDADQQHNDVAPH